LKQFRCGTDLYFYKVKPFFIFTIQNKATALFMNSARSRLARLKHARRQMLFQMPGDMDRVGLAAHVRQQRPRAADTLDDATIFFPSGSARMRRRRRVERLLRAFAAPKRVPIAKYVRPHWVPDKCGERK
jgi:hypothetical protein